MAVFWSFRPLLLFALAAVTVLNASTKYENCRKPALKPKFWKFYIVDAENLLKPNHFRTDFKTW